MPPGSRSFANLTFFTFLCGFFYLRSLEGILFTNCIGRDQQVRCEAMYFQSVFCCIVCILSDALVASGVTVASANKNSMQRNWCLVNAKAREV